MKNEITSLTDDEIQQMFKELSDDSGACSCAIAEIDSEACMYGDSAPNSCAQRSNYSDGLVWIESEMKRLGSEWDRRYPVAKMAEVQIEAISEEEEVPF